MFASHETGDSDSFLENTPDSSSWLLQTQRFTGRFCYPPGWKLPGAEELCLDTDGNLELWDEDFPGKCPGHPQCPQQPKTQLVILGWMYTQGWSGLELCPLCSEEVGNEWAVGTPHKVKNQGTRGRREQPAAPFPRATSLSPSPV